jgi:hypothetical protein
VGAGAVVQDNFFESDHQAARIARFANLVEGIEPTLNISLRHAVAHEYPDFLVLSWNRIFKEGTEFFV